MKALQGPLGDLGLLLSPVQDQLELIFLPSPEFCGSLYGEAPSYLPVSQSSPGSDILIIDFASCTWCHESRHLSEWHHDEKLTLNA